MDELGSDMHRTRNGRLNVDFLSRRLMPRWKMIKIDGVYYERKALAEWLLRRGAYAPASRRPLTPAQSADVANANPYRILGKAPLLNSNRR
jgi:hypothetical protein